MLNTLAHWGCHLSLQAQPLLKPCLSKISVLSWPLVACADLTLYPLASGKEAQGSKVHTMYGVSFVNEPLRIG